MTGCPFSAFVASGGVSEVILDVCDIMWLDGLGFARSVTSFCIGHRMNKYSDDYPLGGNIREENHA